MSERFPPNKREDLDSEGKKIYDEMDEIVETMFGDKSVNYLVHTYALTIN